MAIEMKIIRFKHLTMFKGNNDSILLKLPKNVE